MIYGPNALPLRRVAGFHGGYFVERQDGDENTVNGIGPGRPEITRSHGNDHEWDEPVCRKEKRCR